jgi:dihydroxyacetone kinase
MTEVKPELEKTPVHALREWGLDMEVFQAKAKASLGSTRADLNDIKGVLQQALAEAKQILLDLQKARKPVAAELKNAFERAWNEIEQGFSRAREKGREARQAPPNRQ